MSDWRILHHLRVSRVPSSAHSRHLSSPPSFWTTTHFESLQHTLSRETEITNLTTFHFKPPYPPSTPYSTSPPSKNESLETEEQIAKARPPYYVRQRRFSDKFLMLLYPIIGSYKGERGSL